MIEKDSEAAANHQIALLVRLIRKTKARSKVVFARVVKVDSIYAGEFEAGARHEVGDVLLVALHRTENFVTQSEVQRQPLVHLPAVLNVGIEGAHGHKAFWVSNRDRRRRYVASEEICQTLRLHQLIILYQGLAPSRAGGCGCTCTPGAPRSLRAVEYEPAGSATMIELIQFSPADLSSVPELMSADVLRNDVGNVPRKVAPAFRWRQPDLLEARDSDIRCSKNVRAFIDRIRAQEDSHRLGVKPVVEIAENLIEIVCTEEQLVRECGGEC